MNLCFAMAEIIYSMSCRVYIILRSHFEYKISIRSTRVKKYKKTSSQREKICLNPIFWIDSSLLSGPDLGLTWHEIANELFPLELYLFKPLLRALLGFPQG